MQSITFQRYTDDIPPEIFTGIVAVNCAVFQDSGRSEMQERERLTHRLSRVFHPLILVALDEERVVGFKIGYEEKSDTYHSWLGGVLPDYRRRGIAKNLMETQHEWCKAQGYRYVRTTTRNWFRSMLLLNLRSGFDICGTMIDPKGQLKIQLVKTL